MADIRCGRESCNPRICTEDCIETAPARSSQNRMGISPGVKCGCYFCLRVYDGGEVEEWGDFGRAALCPNCGIDAVLPGETDKEYLSAAHERWFCGQNDQVQEAMPV